MKLKLWGGSQGGVVAPKAPDLSVRFQIVPIPHGRWALRKTHITYSQYSGLQREWITVAEYDTPEAARADFGHLFATTPIDLTP